MYGSEFFSASLWWICPILMIAICFFMMRGRRWPMKCGCGPRDIDNRQTRASNLSLDILDKRYAAGEINKAEYEEIKRTLTGSAGFKTD